MSTNNASNCLPTSKFPIFPLKPRAENDWELEKKSEEILRLFESFEKFLISFRRS